jgi:hypothetical protein
MSVHESKLWLHDGKVRPLTGLVVAQRVCLPTDCTLHDIGLQLAAAQYSCWAMMTRDEALSLLRSLAAHLDVFVTTGDVMREGVMQ